MLINGMEFFYIYLTYQNSNPDNYETNPYFPFNFYVFLKWMCTCYLQSKRFFLNYLHS